MSPSQAPSQGTQILPAMGRLFWMLLGPAGLAFSAVAIVRTGNGWLTAADIAFLVFLGGLIAGRWLEFQGGHPQTAAGEPATWAHFRRYAVVAAVVGLVIWIASNLIGNYWLAH